MNNELAIKLMEMLLNGDKQSLPEQAGAPVEIGKSYFFRTVTHIEVGRVTAVNGPFVTLEDASWIPSTGSYHDCHESGEFDEVEPYPNGSTVNMGSLINFTPWAHKLPRDQK